MNTEPSRPLFTQLCGEYDFLCATVGGGARLLLQHNPPVQGLSHYGMPEYADYMKLMYGYANSGPHALIFGHRIKLGVGIGK